ncbi:acyl-CoA synthetase (AMP-forming)/AMP-acid ligase II [Pseudomonas asplenii]|uniref:Acyl-CoA synthetase (AMP-forming)/AMP-acid ligase II n=1 Tax=Pseudomonas asplenii TaxID=53407 RepID=A0A0N0E1M5_9PSED|nr:AMP-binding protein [Pseudomonas fuscovaginae]KPA87874.1 acyl-CoA synthetase (AMP-forming)/AMP-acid ligase II [Pseudomonas fuscovaginae]
MSVHELKRPPATLSPQPETVSIFPAALEQLRHWAQVSPLHSALRHKRHGQWHSWRWIDTLREVERLADGLRQQGFTADSRLALSGALEPNLLLLALAAHSIGGRVFSLAPDLSVEALGRAFWRLHPSHGFVDSRQQLLDWIAAGDADSAPRVLIANQLPGRLPGLPRQTVLDFAGLCGDSPEPRPIVLWRAPAAQPQLWSEEDSGWQGGLAVVLEQWLNSGHSLAFAESRDSASRDRREVAPSGLLLSPERLQGLADEIEQRLAPQSTWRRRLCEWSLAHPERFVARLLKQRVRRLLGFQRLQYIWQPSHPAKLPATFNQWRLQAPGRKSA